MNIFSILKYNKEISVCDFSAVSLSSFIYRAKLHLNYQKPGRINNETTLNELEVYYNWFRQQVKADDKKSK